MICNFIQFKTYMQDVAFGSVLKDWLYSSDYRKCNNCCASCSDNTVYNPRKVCHLYNWLDFQFYFEQDVL